MYSHIPGQVTVSHIFVLKPGLFTTTVPRCLSAEYRGEKLMMFEIMKTAGELFQGVCSFYYSISEPWFRDSTWAVSRIITCGNADSPLRTENNLKYCTELSNSIAKAKSHSNCWAINRKTTELLQCCFSTFFQSTSGHHLWLACICAKGICSSTVHTGAALIINVHGVMNHALGSRFTEVIGFSIWPVVDVRVG